MLQEEKAANSEKEHMSVVICGHVDSGKSTTTGRLLFELGGIKPREMEKLREEAKKVGKESFAFAFYMDTQKDERERGITIKCNTKSFHTDKYYYSIIDAPGHRDFIKNMISGAAQADVGVLMVPADSGFIAAIAKGDRKKNEVQGSTRQHARLLQLLGVKQLIICVNKMDDDPGNGAYKQERFKEIEEEMRLMLIKVGWPKQFVQNRVPIIPISGWAGDNLITPSTNMNWWKGVDVKYSKTDSIHIHTLKDALNNFVQLSKRNTEAPVRIPISGVHNIKGVGDVLTGRLEQGTVKPGDVVKFLPTDTQSNSCTGKVFSIEMHHEKMDQASAGDNVGMNMRGLNKDNMPKVGDIMVLKSDETLQTTKNFVAQIQVLDKPGEIKVGYSPIGHVRAGRSACKIVKLLWKTGKETNGEKLENPISLKAGDSAEVIFEPQQAFVVDKNENCDGLSRIALMDGNTAVMLGKVINTNIEV